MYLDFTAKPGCEDQINDLYAALVGKPGAVLVHSKSYIEAQIAYIKSPEGESQAHLRESLNTVEDWNDLFPSMKLGTGTFCLSNDPDEEEEVRRDVKFVLDNRFLFSEIKGLDRARQDGFTDFAGDYLVNGHIAQSPEAPEPTFADLPKGTSKFYELCVQHSRPDLWAAFHAFSVDPSDERWETLRSKVIPWSGNRQIGFGDSVWQLVERQASARDGEDYGLYGRYRDGKFPSVLEVRQAVQ